jgi:hypothetical protein
MLLHIGDDVVVPKKNIIAILEMDTNSSIVTKEFLEIAGDEGFIEKISEGKESSFVITTEKIYYSPISCATLKKRAEGVIEGI